MATPCADPTCDRSAMRTRDGQRFCMYHPAATPPAMDLLTGKLRDDKHQTQLQPPPAPTQPDRPAYREPGRVLSAAARDPRAPEAVRLYQSGETLQAVAEQLHVNPTRLRTMLVEHGVTIRKRGQVVERTAPPAPTQDESASQEGDRDEQPAPVAPALALEPATEPGGMDVLRAALATPPPVPIGGGTRCLLEKGEAHRDPQVRQAAKHARRSIDALIAAIQHADHRQARRPAGAR